MLVDEYMMIYMRILGRAVVAFWAYCLHILLGHFYGVTGVNDAWIWEEHWSD